MTVRSRPRRKAPGCAKTGSAFTVKDVTYANWKQVLQEVGNHTKLLNAWESGFVVSLGGVHTMSQRQWEVLARIADKVDVLLRGWTYRPPRRRF